MVQFGAIASMFFAGGFLFGRIYRTGDADREYRVHNTNQLELPLAKINYKGTKTK
jgi:hypothetical protein